MKFQPVPFKICVNLQSKSSKILKCWNLKALKTRSREISKWLLLWEFTALSFQHFELLLLLDLRFYHVGNSQLWFLALIDFPISRFHCFKIWLLWAFTALSFRRFEISPLEISLLWDLTALRFHCFEISLLQDFTALRFHFFKISPLRNFTAPLWEVTLFHTCEQFQHWVQPCLSPRNTKGGSITVPLTSCLTGLDESVYK